MEPSWSLLDNSKPWNYENNGWDYVNQLRGQLQQLGYTGDPFAVVDNPFTWYDGEAQVQRMAPELEAMLADRGLSLGHRNVGADMQFSILDNQGRPIYEPTHYDSNDGNWLEKAVPMALGAITGGLGAPLGAAMGLGSGVLGSAVGGGIMGGATSAVMGGDPLRGALSGGIGGALNGYFSAPSSSNGAFLGEGVSSGVPAWDAAMNSGNSLASVPDEITASLDAYAANPMMASQVANATLPGDLSLGAPSISQPFAFNAAADSQLASNQLGITGDQSAASATIPRTVNLVNGGGTSGTAGGLTGLLQTGSQVASDAVSGLANNPLSQWMKDNPLLGRLALAGVGSLASSSGGGSSSAPRSSSVVGPPVQWNSPIQQGLLSPVQQYAPPAITQMRPAGLLAQGFENDGAWRYLKG